MSHHITLRSLVIDFKRSMPESSALAREKALVGVVAVALAYAAPLPDHGPMGATNTYRAVVSRLGADFASDINEHLYFDMRATLELAQAVYCLRYETAHSPLSAVAAPAPSALINDLVGDDAETLVNLWLERFLNAVRVYQQERSAKGVK